MLLDQKSIDTLSVCVRRTMRDLYNPDSETIEVQGEPITESDLARLLVMLEDHMVFVAKHSSVDTVKKFLNSLRKKG